MGQHRGRAAASVVAVGALVAGLTGPVAAGATPTDSSSGGRVALRRMGTASLAEVARARPAARTEASAVRMAARSAHRRTPSRAARAGVAAAGAGLVSPNPKGRRVVTANPGFSGFSALSHRDQRLAGNGNQFDLEPPDQGLCVGNGFVLEMVNAALSVYDTNGVVVTPTVSLNDFWGVAPNVNRAHNPPTFGPFVFDPRCFYDSAVNRWFLVAAEIDQDPFTGAFGPGSHTYLAVSQTGDPNGTYGLFSIDTADPGGDGCPCFGDFPQVGADANGFYVSTNEFSINGPEYNGAQIYAASKRGLAAAANGAALPVIVHLKGGVVAGVPSFTVQPAVSPPGGAFPPNRAYFLSTMDFNGAIEDRLAVWALNNTSSLGSSRPNVTLTKAVVRTQAYGLAPLSTQKNGPHPLGQSQRQPVGVIDSGFDDFGSAPHYAGGLLWNALTTVVGPPNGPSRAGIAWFAVRPSFANGKVGGSVARQGYVAVDGQNLIFPSVAVNPKGQGVIAYNLVGPGYFPSAAYTPVSAKGAGVVHLSAAGTQPLDQRTCYPVESSVCRYGDYSQAVVGREGGFWLANEVVLSESRTANANWNTFIGHLLP